MPRGTSRRDVRDCQAKRRQSGNGPNVKHTAPRSSNLRAGRLKCTLFCRHCFHFCGTVFRQRYQILTLTRGCYAAAVPHNPGFPLWRDICPSSGIFTLFMGKILAFTQISTESVPTYPGSPSAWEKFLILSHIVGFFLCGGTNAPAQRFSLFPWERMSSVRGTVQAVFLLILQYSSRGRLVSLPGDFSYKDKYSLA